MQILEIFYRFLVLGCLSFGGPAAHIGYFQTALVKQYGWLTQDHYAKLVALSQFLPGPSSSQVGFAIGLHRGGLGGGLAAFIGFTLPSFLLMLLLAFGTLTDTALLMGAVKGLKVFAVVMVADAVISMYRSFCQRWTTSLIAITSALMLILLPSLSMQIAILLLAALAGMVFTRALTQTAVDDKANRAPDKQSNAIRFNWLSLALFAALLALLPWFAQWSSAVKLFSNFYQTGSFVFGGGHVVLPMLQHSVGGALSNDQFLTGYATAQVLPGPMFALAAYLGAQLLSQPLYGALLATVAIFLPGFLLVIGLKDGWQAMLKRPKIAGASAGINASVVGLLIAALYQPVFTSAVHSVYELLLCLLGLTVLRLSKCPVVPLAGVFTGLGFLM